jgi:hypothetical protein
MVTETTKRSGDVVRYFTRLDLYHHSLRLAGERLVLRAHELELGSLADLREKSLELAKDWFELVGGLREHLYDEDVPVWRSAVIRVERAINRASRATTATVQMVNIWRVVEAGDQFLSAVAPKYGYTRLSGESEVGLANGDEPRRAELTRLFTEYEDAMGGGAEPTPGSSPPFLCGILRWRGSQLFYVERVEDGARWVELDPEYEPQTVGEELGGVEFAEARTIEGHEIELMLDMDVSGEKVDEYIHSQRGHEYLVSGYQFVGEKQTEGGGQNRRR